MTSQGEEVDGGGEVSGSFGEFFLHVVGEEEGGLLFLLLLLLVVLLIGVVLLLLLVVLLPLFVVILLLLLLGVLGVVVRSLVVVTGILIVIIWILVVVVVWLRHAERDGGLSSRWGDKGRRNCRDEKGRRGEEDVLHLDGFLFSISKDWDETFDLYLMNKVQLETRR